MDTRLYRTRIEQHNWEDSVLYLLVEIDTDNYLQTCPTYNDAKQFAVEHYYIVTDYIVIDHYSLLDVKKG